MSDLKTKICNGCHVEKSIAEYHTRRSGNLAGKPFSRCKQCYTAEAKQRKVDYPDYYVEYIRRRWQKNRTSSAYKEKRRIQRLNLYRNSPKYRDAIRTANNKWQKTPRGKQCVRNADARYRAHEKSVVADLTPEQWTTILDLQERRCAKCLCKFTKKKRPEQDHIKPVSLGGDLTMRNVQALCRSCNAGKSNREIDYRTTQHKKAVTSLTAQ